LFSNFKLLNYLIMSKYIKASRYAAKVVSRRMRMTGNDFAKANYLADILNLPNCATEDTQFNTGVPLCRLKKKKLIGVMFADPGVYFTTAHRASASAFLAEVATKTTAERGGRLYPLWNIRNLDDQTGEPTKGGVGNLTTTQANVADAIPAMQFGYDGDEIQQRILALIESGSYTVFLVDEGYTVYGTTSGDDLVGFSTEQIYTNISKFPVSDFVNQYSFSITFSSMIQWKANSAFVVTTSAITTKVGLINVPLSILSSAANVHKVLAVAVGGTNLQELYGTAISALTWTAKLQSDGSAFTVTGVANNATDDCYNVTLDTTMWTALASGDKVDIYGPTAAALAGASVTPYEMFKVTVTKP
jgi:hypothetical protein